MIKNITSVCSMKTNSMVIKMKKNLRRKMKVNHNHNEVTQSCPTLCDPVDCSPPGFSVHGILQARILEWVAISFSRGSSQPRDQTRVSHIGGRCFNLWATRLTQQKLFFYEVKIVLASICCTLAIARFYTEHLNALKNLILTFITDSKSPEIAHLRITCDSGMFAPRGLSTVLSDDKSLPLQVWDSQREM